MTFPLPHAIRPAVSSDLAMLVHAWTSEHRHSPFARFVRDQEYFPDQRQLVMDLLATSKTLVACNPDEPKHIFGYICFGPGNSVHWVYVKSAYRRIGLADVLLKAAFPARAEDEALFATQAGRMWSILEPSIYDLRRLHGPDAKWTPGALTRRHIYYRPHLLMRAN